MAAASLVVGVFIKLDCLCLLPVYSCISLSVHQTRKKKKKSLFCMVSQTKLDACIQNVYTKRKGGGHEI